MAIVGVGIDLVSIPDFASTLEHTFPDGVRQEVVVCLLCQLGQRK